jgi:DNA-3-methyladenine glycosylase II
MFERSEVGKTTWFKGSFSILAALRVVPKQKRSLLASVAPVAAVLDDQTSFEAALVALAARDAPFVATLLGDEAPPRLRRRAAGFEGLAAIIVAQQVSTASADAIFARLQARLGTVTAATLSATEEADLIACGLSAPKRRTLRTIAEAVVTGRLDLAALAVLDADDAHRTLVALKGVGPWTADIFLLFCLGHADAWPVGDLALQEGVRLALGLSERPTAKALAELGERWRPWRGVAAHCLWAYYGKTRTRRTTLADTASVGNAPHAKRRTR